MFAHVDADAFFASVLQRENPKLKGKELLALGMGAAPHGASGALRGGCVIAASYEAKALGVKTGMPLREARKLAPHAIAMPADFSATGLASDQLFALLERWCPGGMERASVDEGYMDLQCACLDMRRRVSGATRHDTNFWELFAKNLQEEAHRFLDLPISIGIAETKTLAKMGSKARKPRGICIILPVSSRLPAEALAKAGVAPSEESRCVSRDSFLREKPVHAIPGIGRVLTPKLQAQGILSAWDFAKAPQDLVKKLIGKHGVELQAEVNGCKVYEMMLEPDPPQSISRCRSFRATSDRNFLYAQIVTHLERCSSKLRRKDMECASLGLWFRTAEGRFLGAERKFGRYLSEEALLLPFAKEAFDASICAAVSAALLGMTQFTQAGLVLHSLRPQGPRQSSLFEHYDHERLGNLQKTLDELRSQFGKESIGYAPTLGGHSPTAL